eukprot:scaffold14556_cov67-Phaeocystis_antarctica.AAC.1
MASSCCLVCTCFAVGAASVRCSRPAHATSAQPSVRHAIAGWSTSTHAFARDALLGCSHFAPRGPILKRVFFRLQGANPYPNQNHNPQP